MQPLRDSRAILKKGHRESSGTCRKKMATKIWLEPTSPITAEESPTESTQTRQFYASPRRNCPILPPSKYLIYLGYQVLRFEPLSRVKTTQAG